MVLALLAAGFTLGDTPALARPKVPKKPPVQPEWADPEFCKPAPKSDTGGGGSRYRIDVDLTRQRAALCEGPKKIREMPISSGKPGHRTPTGNFRTERCDPDHRSSIYGTSMPYFQRINGPIGIHQGKLPGRPDSHGCIRMGHDDAKDLCERLEPGTPVRVYGKAK
jgi:lipoprotein-anchoring transpeptidase ErfK/SrfK